MESSVKNQPDLKAKFKKNPAWFCLLFTLFGFFLLPEYISPFILFASYIVFKRQWTREGRLAKVGRIGKIEMAFMCLMLISALWSPTKLDTLGSAGLWWAVILIQVMIYNLARTKERINKVLTAIVASAAINGIVGAIQFATYVLNCNGYIPSWLVVPTPFYRNLDVAVYGAMPFKISTYMWSTRASGFFSNPNLLASFMLVAFPLAVYLLLNAQTKKRKRLSALSIVFISFGMASTQTRAGCYVLIAAWVILFLVFMKKHLLKLLALFVPVCGSSVFALLVRYGQINIYPNVQYIPVSPEEAIISTAKHFEIWGSLVDYLTHHVTAFIFGTGFGCEQTGNILLNEYALKKPHAHNFVIEIWTELGIIGTIFLAVIIIYAIGKLLEINSSEFRALSLEISVLVSFGSLLIFGLSDYIFNSPKQIILFIMLIGIIQAVSYTYDKREIQRTSDISRLAKDEIHNIINQ